MVPPREDRQYSQKLTKFEVVQEDGAEIFRQKRVVINEWRKIHH
jgi:hypothetical protein